MSSVDTARERAQDAEAELGRARKALEVAEQRLEGAKRGLAGDPRSPALAEAEAAQAELTRATLLAEAYQTRHDEALTELRDAQREQAIGLVREQQAIFDGTPAKLRPLLDELVAIERRTWSIIEQINESVEASADAAERIEVLCAEAGISPEEHGRRPISLEVVAHASGIRIEQARRADDRGYLVGGHPADFLTPQPETSAEHVRTEAEWLLSLMQEDQADG